MQTMSSRNAKKGKTVDADRVCAHYTSEDQLVRWVSSHPFYLRQMCWSVRTVTEYWRSFMFEYRGMWPAHIPLRIRFCVSWLSGLNCLDWPARDICVWLNHRLSRGHKFESVMHMSWLSNTDACPVVETARPPWSRLNIPCVVGRVHVPPPQFILRVETTVKDTDISCFPEEPMEPAASEAPAASVPQTDTDVVENQENAVL